MKSNANKADLAVLSDVNIQIPSGQLVGIIGKVASGKSSLINSILCETKVHQEENTKISLAGDIAYVSQTAWIQNLTLKDNILFGSDYNEKKYKDVIHYSCLADDLKNLIKGDQTEIGEKGVNLSGGQRLRVSLARALYSNKDIVMLDDPLSALDAHVGKFIFQETFLKYLKGKTIILVTHALHFAKFLDQIYLIENGRIILGGNYDLIKEHELF